MPQQPQQLSNGAFFDDASGGQEFSVVLRGYDRQQVDGHVQRLTAAISQAEQARAEAEQRMNESQRRLRQAEDRKSTRLNSSHLVISYAVFCLKKKSYRRKTASLSYLYAFCRTL